MASSNQAPPATVVELPNEIWKLVISNLENINLKTTRQVNSTFKDFATPKLFRHVCLSLPSDNQCNLIELANSEDLSQHVQVMYLDLTTDASNMTPREYAQWMSAHLETYAGLPQSEDAGPLSCSKLYKVLESNPAKDLGVDYLSGSPRTALIAGYTQTMARAATFAEMTNADNIYVVVQGLLARLRNIHTIASVSSWDFADDYSSRFSRYLRRHLPEKTFKQIPGFEDALAVHEIVNETEGWTGPGVAARQSHLLCPSPRACNEYTRWAEFEITVATFRALKDSPHIQLKTLCLPGPDCVGGRLSLPTAATKRTTNPPSNFLGGAPMSKTGFTSLVSLTSVHYGPDTCTHDNLLLPMFQHLKTLELNMDYYHPGPCSIMSRFSTDGARLPRALQTMSSVEQLMIGYCKPIELPNAFQAPAPVSLYHTILYRDEDFQDDKDEDDDDDDDTPPETPVPGGPPPPDFLNFLQSIIGQAAPAAAAAPSPSSNTQGQQSATTSTPQPPLQQAPSQGSTTLSAGIAMGGPLFLPANLGNNEHYGEQRKSFPDGPLVPNPWPKLMQLSIWSMPATRTDVLRLIKTVAPSLRSLDMRNIRFAEIKTPNRSTAPANYGLFGQAIHANGSIGAHGPPPAAPPTAPVDGDENADPSEVAKKEQWYDTIEVMADVLRLQSCTFVLGKVDKERLVTKLEAQVEGFGKSGVNINKVVANYILHGNGMGLSLFAAEEVKKAKARAETLKIIKAMPLQAKEMLLKAWNAGERFNLRQTGGRTQALEITEEGKETGRVIYDTGADGVEDNTNVLAESNAKTAGL